MHRIMKHHLHFSGSGSQQSLAPTIMKTRIDYYDEKIVATWWLQQKECRGHKFKRKGKRKVFWCVPSSVSTTTALMDTKSPYASKYILLRVRIHVESNPTYKRKRTTPYISFANYGGFLPPKYSSILKLSSLHHSCSGAHSCKEWLSHTAGVKLTRAWY